MRQTKFAFMGGSSQEPGMLGLEARVRDRRRIWIGNHTAGRSCKRPVGVTVGRQDGSGPVLAWHLESLRLKGIGYVHASTLQQSRQESMTFLMPSWAHGASQHLSGGGSHTAAARAAFQAASNNWHM